MIGDVDPEDGYDATDPPARRLAVLEATVVSIRAERAADPERAERRRVDALRVLGPFLVDRPARRVRAIKRALDALAADGG